jgi:Meckel syndrome type 1 protein
LLLQVNSVDNWGRHRIEGYGFVRFPQEPGYHRLEVETWRPRGSLTDEIHSFFLGGGIKIMQLEEIIRTKYLDKNAQSDIVNRFGLETENSGTVKVTLNICHQSGIARKENRKKLEMEK